MSYTPQDLDIVFDDGMLVLVGSAFVAQVQSQASRGISSSGEQTDHDWRQSGDLLDKTTVDQEGVVGFTVPYAEHVERVAPFAGVAPQLQEEIDQRLQPIITRGLVFKKV